MLAYGHSAMASADVGMVSVVVPEADWSRDR
jgi:hypothetical protein